jgi:wobble nucleotide-excising tRNase
MGAAVLVKKLICLRKKVTTSLIKTKDLGSFEDIKQLISSNVLIYVEDYQHLTLVTENLSSELREVIEKCGAEIYDNEIQKLRQYLESFSDKKSDYFLDNEVIENTISFLKFLMEQFPSLPISRCLSGTKWGDRS